MPLPLLLLCSVTIFFVLYAPQPLLALFSEQFAISPAISGSLMSLTMLPLAIAPIFYGLLLAKRNVLKVLRLTMILLAISCVLFPLCEDFRLLQVLRFVQGLLLPAALTSMTGYIGERYQGEHIQQKMGWYIASTIVGGYFGRMLAASFAEWFTWQSFYYVIAALLLILASSIRSRHGAVTVKAAASPRDYLRPLKDRPLIALYLAVFCMFFCFAALMNYLPFILKDSFAITASQDIGLVYTGYLIGAVLSVSSPWLLRHSRSAKHFLLSVFTLYSLTLALMQGSNLWLFITAFTLFCAAMFMIHTTAAGYANRISSAKATVTNGAYVSFYYSGGALGSFLPGFIYQYFGQTGFLLTLLLVSLCGAWCVRQTQAKPVNHTV
ncbi:MFS transporter [Pseudoalteromonas fenneropenaei]|uniref:MFS transporter n=1 Tax=Pseudoalteromonas fenneropenaei TaxID=1737459 RepID=A0ABV7CKQ7_9GAMM